MFIVKHVNLGTKETYNGYTIKLPIDFKINKSTKKGFLYRIGAKYITNAYDYEPAWAAFIGFQYCWCF
ncbi:MAG: hypothetical protein Q4F84_04575 [Fibrobacter sp.]|nr:hypothetical protein [Fibrobacter sp.]